MTAIPELHLALFGASLGIFPPLVGSKVAATEDSGGATPWQASSMGSVGH